SHDLTAEWLSARRCREREPGLSPRIRGGIAAADHSVDPRAVVRALRVAAEADGVEPLAVDAREVVAGRIDARHVVVSAGAWSGTLGLAVSPPIRPAKGKIMRLRGTSTTEGS